MIKTAGRLTFTAMLMVGAAVFGALLGRAGRLADEPLPLAQNTASSPVVPPSETIPPYTPLPTLTPSQTLKPPPTLEPPTATPSRTPVPSVTPTPTLQIAVTIEGLHGLESPTPSTTPGCKPREDWKLTYTVQFDDTLSAIADRYGTWVDELAAGNCLADKNLIVVGQVLRVPGEAPPSQYVCTPWEALTPFDGMTTVPTSGTLTFNWRGPQSPKYLIRVYRPDGSTYEQLVELRQNGTANLNTDLPQEGTYTWYVYPLDENFVQISCLEGGPWTFYKGASPPPTPTLPFPVVTLPTVVFPTP